jgi:hypothetical protein
MRKWVSFACMLLALQTAAASAENIKVSADYLYWTAEQTDMEFIRTGANSVDFPGIVLGTDKVHRAKYRWQSGFRVGIEQDQSCDFFRPGVFYTYFHTKGAKTVIASADSLGVFQGLPSLPPAFPGTVGAFPGFIPVAAFAESRVKLGLDYIDLNLVGSDYGTECVGFNWDFGFRGAYVKSDWRTRYLITVTNAVEDPVLAPEDARIRWKYSGAGIKLGLGGVFAFGSGFNLFQTVTGALLLGQQKDSVKAFIITPDDGLRGIADVQNRYARVVPIIQSQTGLAWTSGCECGWFVSASVAFEFQKWVNIGINRFYTTNLGARFKSSVTDVDFYGLTASVALEF